MMYKLAIVEVVDKRCIDNTAWRYEWVKTNEKAVEWAKTQKKRKRNVVTILNNKREYGLIEF